MASSIRARSNTSPERSKRKCAIPARLTTLGEIDRRNHACFPSTSFVRTSSAGSTCHATAIRGNIPRDNAAFTRNSAQTCPSSPSISSVGPRPELQPEEVQYLIKKANESCAAVIRHAETLTRHKKWQSVGKYRGISLYRGNDARLGNMTTSNDSSQPSGVAKIPQSESLSGVVTIVGSIEDVAKYFDQQTTSEIRRKQLDDVLDTSVLYPIISGKPNAPFYRVAVKYIAWEAPSSWTRGRDFCYIECQNTFRHSSGRRGWVLSMHSIQMPACPERSGVVRCSVYNSGYVVVESTKPGCLDILHILQLNFKGHLPAFLVLQALKRKMGNLLQIRRELLFSRIQHRTILQHQELAPKNARTTCNCCSRKFSSFFARKTRCRICGQVVCHACAPLMDYKSVDKHGNVINKTRICTSCFRNSDSIGTAQPLLPKVEGDTRNFDGNSTCSSIGLGQSAMRSNVFDKALGGRESTAPRLTIDRKGNQVDEDANMRTFIWIDKNSKDEQPIALLEQCNGSDNQMDNDRASTRQPDSLNSSRFSYKRISLGTAKRTSGKPVTEMSASERMDWIQNTYNQDGHLQAHPPPSREDSFVSRRTSSSSVMRQSGRVSSFKTAIPAPSRGSKLLISTLNYDTLDIEPERTKSASRYRCNSLDDIPIISVSSSNNSVKAEAADSVHFGSNTLMYQIDSYDDRVSCLEPEPEPSFNITDIRTDSIDSSLPGSSDIQSGWDPSTFLSPSGMSSLHDDDVAREEGGDDIEVVVDDDEERTSVFCDLGTFGNDPLNDSDQYLPEYFDGDRYSTSSDYRPSSYFDDDDDATDEVSAKVPDEALDMTQLMHSSSNLQRLQDRMVKNSTEFRDTEDMVVMEEEHSVRMQELDLKKVGFTREIVAPGQSQAKEFAASLPKVSMKTENAEDWRTSSFIRGVHRRHRNRMKSLQIKMQHLEENDDNGSTFGSSYQSSCFADSMRSTTTSEKKSL
nr:adherance factor putative [Albugo laibachii Nc14]|eukprot:CCA18399.1 adherance factor putative [Albugo laibachii Nc14]